MVIFVNQPQEKNLSGICACVPLTQKKKNQTIKCILELFSALKKVSKYLAANTLHLPPAQFKEQVNCLCCWSEKQQIIPIWNYSSSKKLSNSRKPAKNFNQNLTDINKIKTKNQYNLWKQIQILQMSANRNQ